MFAGLMKEKATALALAEEYAGEPIEDVRVRQVSSVYAVRGSLFDGKRVELLVTVRADRESDASVDVKEVSKMGGLVETRRGRSLRYADLRRVGSRSRSAAVEPRIIIEYPSVGATFHRDEYGVYRYDEYPSSSVLAGQERRSWLDSFKTLEQAREAYPDAEYSGPRYRPPSLSHLRDEEDL